MAKRLIVLFLILGTAYYLFYYKRIEEIKANYAPKLAQEVKIITPQDISTSLGYYRGKVMLLYIYKSSSIVSKWLFPSIARVAIEFKDNKAFVPFIISLDEDKMDLATFVYDYNPSFNLYMLEKGGVSGMKAILRGNNIHFNDAPLTILIDVSGMAMEVAPGISFQHRLKNQIAEKARER